MQKKTLTEIIKLLENKEVSSCEVVTSCLDNIQKNAHLNALNYVNSQKAIEQAKKIDQKRAKGDKLGLLAGVPIVLKDNICTEGMPTTCSSKMLQNFVPQYNATVVNKLLEQDAIIIGKANMDEFAMGSSNETSYTGKVLNPYNNDYVPGGSSGGSAASVAANLAYAALGSDTGGSIRQPASLCGVVGVKPTYGTVSRYGLIAFASSLDQIGPITKTVEDATLMTKLISGNDELDSTSFCDDYPELKLNQDFSYKGKKIGIPKEFFDIISDRDVKDVMGKHLKKLESEGAEIIEMSMKALEYAIPTYYILSSAEATSNLARFDGIKYGYRSTDFDDLLSVYYKSRTEGFGAEVQRRIMLGNYVLSSGYFDAYYKKAQKVQTLISNTFVKAFQKVDLIITPTSPTPAFKFGEKQGDVVAMYLSDIFTVPVNIAGNCAISIPAGLSSKGLPIGLQIIAPHFKDQLMFDAGQEFERLAK